MVLGFRNSVVISFVIIIIIILIAYNIYNVHGANYEDFMYGYWQGDEGFCEECEVSSMQLFIGNIAERNWFDKLKGKRERLAYLIMNDNITNQQIKITYRPSGGFSLKVSNYEISAEVEFQEDCGIPGEVIFEFDMVKGRLRIHDGKKIYAVMYKNHEISELAKN